MTVLAATGLEISINLLLVVFVLISLLMSMIILMQRPKNEGLGAAFGSGATDQLFGAQTTTVLQKGTVYLASLFFVLTIVLAVLITKRNSSGQSFVATVEPPPAPAAPASIAPPSEKALESEAVTPPVEAPKPVETPVPPVVPPAEMPAPPSETPVPKPGEEVINDAAKGAIIGNQSGAAGEGALIGAGLGAPAAPEGAPKPAGEEKSAEPEKPADKP
ncbi:preprotein translocase subunit SecG [Luteolibacter sp. Populi]|uniref:preprotein translocase subunit SecG n=1 Tax=Luteolibacter sp. Populi TaxID=3230487 RepID=UPI0034652FFE